MLDRVGGQVSGISASGGVASTGTVVFSNSNGVSFGVNGNTITASVAPGGVGISAGSQSVNTGTVVFSNSNNVSFGMSGSSQVTASAAINVSAGTTSNLLSALTFSNANGVSFGLNASTLTASVAAQSNQSAIKGLGVSNTGSTAGNTGISTGVDWVFAASGNATASESTAVGGPNTIWLSVPSQSVQTQNCVDATMAGNTSGTLALVSSGTLTLAGGNNITLSQVGNAVTISGANAGGAQTGISGVADSAHTQTIGTVSFANSNGVTFGISTGNNTGTITASVSQSADTMGWYATSNTTGQSSSTTLDVRSITINAAGGFSAGFSNGSIQLSGAPTSSVSVSGWMSVVTNGNTISLGATTTMNLYASGNTFGTSSGTADMRTLSIQGSGEISVAASNSGWVISAPAQSVQTQNCVDVTAAGNTTGTLALVSSGTLTLAGGNNITLSQNGNAITISGPNAGGAQTGISGIADSAHTQTIGTVSFANSNGVTFGLSTGANTGTITASVAAQSNQTLSAIVSSNTVGNTSAMTLDARSVSFQGYGAASVGLSTTNTGSSILISVAAQTNQSGNVYASSNTTVGTSGTYDARTISMAGAGAVSIQASNSGWVVSSPVTSSLSATGWASISTNGATISIGASTTMSNYAVGNTFGTSNGSVDIRTVSISAGSGLQVAASNSGWVLGVQPQSVSEPFPILTGTAYSSHAPASWWFNRVVMDAPLAVSNINVVKSLSVSVPQATSQGSAGTDKYSYSHGITVFSRQDYGAHSSNLTTVTTASFGLTASISYTSTAQSVAYSYVTNTTGGTTSFSTTSSDGGWSAYFSGPFLFAVPCVTTFVPGEYFFAHAHSSTTATNNSNVTLLSFSNLHVAPQVVGPLGVPQSSGTQASVNPWGMGAGIASAVTTNASMAGSVVSGATQNNWYVALSNV